MGLGKAFTSVTMPTLGIGFGSIVKTSGSRVVYKQGGIKIVLEGKFDYQFGTLFGADVNSITEVRNGKKIFEIEGLKINATDSHLSVLLLQTGSFDLFASTALKLSDTLIGSKFNDRIYSFNGPDKVLGKGGSDEIFLGRGADTGAGGGGRDAIFGEGGRDTWIGGAGDDLLVGGLGKDKLLGGTGKDLAGYDFSVLGLTASLVNPKKNTGEAAGDKYFSIEGLVGTNQGDNLTGNKQANLLIGRSGDDFIFGRAGKDNIRGDGGDDTLKGEDGLDVLRGGEGHDNLIGGSGADTLVGGEGWDTLTGGPGRDVFVLHNNAWNDVVTDFEDGDVIRVTTGASNIAHLQFQDVGGNAIVASAFGGTTQWLELQGVSISELSVDDFVFV
jgi:Ca2+-binding RTX toxin-like protein